MDKITCGIDVSKNRLDVAVRPSGELFAVPRTGAGHVRAAGPSAALTAEAVVIDYEMFAQNPPLPGSSGPDRKPDRSRARPQPQDRFAKWLARPRFAPQQDVKKIPCVAST
jgi:hypothetical protein